MSPLSFIHSRRKRRASALLVSAAMIAGAFGPGFDARAVDPPTTPTPGFNLIASDLDFILQQIKIAEAHAAGGQLFGPGPNQVNAPQLPHGLRTVTGELNNATPGQAHFGAADVVFPRETTPVFRPAENFDPDGPGPAPSSPTSYTQTKGIVVDSQPRVISNLIVDQTAGNPAAVAAAGRNDNAVEVDHDSDVTTPALFEMPNVAPDAGLSAPYNSWFTFFGQFFDHGLDLVNKGGSGTVFMPLQPDDPLYVAGSPTNFMVLSRATNRPGPDGVVGDNPATAADESIDDIHEHTNQTSPFVDQNQTYTSHPSHQVFLREYELNASLDPVSTGRMLAGASGGLATWAEVKAQAADLLGIQLSDRDALDVPLLAADPYGRFLRGSNGYVQVATSGGLVQGNPAANGGQGVAVPANAFRTGHPFLADLAHHAAPVGNHDNNPATPDQALTPDADSAAGPDDHLAATYDNELLDAHFIAGDGRVNENVALTAVHHVFHSEHNRLNDDIKALINIDPRPAFQAEWHLGGAAWNGERIFQAAKFVTEMQYQHLVFEEFARKMAPGINVFGEGGFLAHHPDINPSILAEFAHAAYRLGHSMLPETVARTNADGSDNSAGLIDVFLNPLAFLDDGSGGTLTADQAAGAIVRGLTRQAGNELDEFVTEAVRNNLLGLPLDLAAINIARGRDTGIPPLNKLRREIHAEAGSPAMEPYSSWVDFGFSLRNPESLVNFVAAYGTHPTVVSASGLAAKRAAAALLVACKPAVVGTPMDCYDFMNSTGATWVTGPGGVTVTGLDNVDLWVGGLAEKQNPFGGLLGTTLNYIFELQLERLQTGDRLYYLSRLAGTNMLTQLEENSFADLVMRNTDAEHLPLDVFSRPDFTFEVANLGTSGPVTDDPATPWDESDLLVREPNGTLRFNGGEHVLWGGTAGTDRVYSSEGDDTIWGDGGNDRLEGGTGNDQIHGGEGDDIITDTFGDDNLKGGLGNDAINAGDGIDLYLGDFGQDYLIGGDDDEQEGFAGPGDDFMYAGDALDEVSGNEGDDWIDGGLADDTLQGDNGDPLELDAIGGHDVIIGNSGSEDLHGEGGNDVMVLDSGGIELVEGMVGFDWATHKGDTQPANSDLGVLPVAIPPPLPEDVRDQFKLTEALSGWQYNDILRGDDRLAADMVGHELTSDDFGLVNGLAGLLPAGTTTFTNGNIIIGGAGNDLIEGRGGDDLLDGDAWLNVRISVRSATDPNMQIQTVDRVKDLQAAVFAGLINPGQLRIVREILSNPGTDTALFSGPQSEYTITNAGGVVTVSHLGGTGADGTDTLRNFEFLQFADGTIAVPAPAPPATPTGVTATALNSSTIQVTWNLSPGATSYEVSVNNGAFTTVPGGATATSFTQTGVPQNTTRSYRVRAVSGIGTSAPSAPVTATTPFTMVVSPTAFGFGNVGTGSATTTVTVTNNSNTPETITLTKAGTRQADYTIVNNTCTGLVASGASCTYQVTFNPANLGLLGNLVANLSGRPATVTASVTAPAASAVTTFSGMGS